MLRSTLARLLSALLPFVVSACGGGAHNSVGPALPPTLLSPTAAYGSIESSASAPAIVHFRSILTPQQTAGGITIGADGFVYLTGISAFLKYDGIRFTRYPYIHASGDTQLSIVTTKLRKGPDATVWAATDQCCELPTGYDFQYFEALGRSGHIGLSSLVITTHFGGGITSFAQAPDGNIWSALTCAPPVCGDNSLIAILDATFNQSAGPRIPLGDSLGEMTSGSDGAMYAIDYEPLLSKVKVVRMNVATKTITRSYALPSLFARGTISDLVTGPDGALWFTAQSANRIGRLKLTGAFTSYAVPTANAGLGGIAAGSDNALWFTEANANKIGRVALDGTIKEYAVPTRGAAPIGITANAPACTPSTIYFTETNGLGILTF